MTVETANLIVALYVWLTIAFAIYTLSESSMDKTKATGAGLLWPVILVAYLLKQVYRLIVFIGRALVAGVRLIIEVITEA